MWFLNNFGTAIAIQLQNSSMARIMVNWDNYEKELPTKHHSTFRTYANTPTWTGTNGEIWYNDETDRLEPMSEGEMDDYRIKPNVCEAHDLELQDEDYAL